jgi:hypothetical protein
VLSDVCAKNHDHWVDGWGSTIRPMSARAGARHGSNPPAEGQFSAKKPLRLKKLTTVYTVQARKGKYNFVTCFGFEKYIPVPRFLH